MGIEQWFLVWIGLQEVIAAGIYLSQGKWWPAAVWTCYGIACLGLSQLQ